MPTLPTSGPFAEQLAQQPEWAQLAIRRFGIVAAEAVGGSDRACAIVMLAALEEMLRLLLSNFLPDSRVSLNKLVREGQMGQLIDLAEALGVIYPRLAKCLHSLNKVRNAFAHRILEDPTFDSKAVRDEINGMVAPLVLKNDKRKIERRDLFRQNAGLAFLTLTLRAGFIKKLDIGGPDLEKLVIDMALVPAEAEIMQGMFGGVSEAQ